VLHGGLEVVDVAEELGVGGLPFGRFVYFEPKKVVEPL
jgi:hypothetical protein